MGAEIRVLHVDDDPEFVDLAAEFLEREDERIEVITATSAAEGLDRLDTDRVDCVVSDYEMPGQDGLAFLDAVREAHGDLPFLLYTGKGSEEVASEAVSRGVTDYLQKSAGTDQYALLANRVANAVESHRSRRALEEQIRRLETLVSNLPGMVYRCRNERGWPMEYVDGDCEELTGYPAAALESGEVVWGEDVLHPEDRERMWTAVQEALETGDAFEVTYRILTAAGETRWMWERGRAVYDDPGQRDGSGNGDHPDDDGDGATGDDPVALEGFITDITDRKRREDALSALHEATRAFMDATEQEAVAERAVETAREVLDRPLNAVWLYDGDADVLRPATATEAGASLVDEVPTYTGGESLAWDVFQRGEYAVYEDLSAEPGRYNPDSPIESEIILPLGEHGVMALGATEPAAFDDVDITLARLLANTTASALDRADREAELRARSRELERQNERLEEVASVLGHDLRTPLGTASGSVALAREECDSEVLEPAAAALDRMEEFVERTLTLARSGRVVGDPQPVALDTLVERCWTDIGADDATLVLDDPPTVEADPERLRSLFENLFRNSVEHGSTSSRTQSGDSVEHGGQDDGTVIVRVGGLDDGAGFYVADDGPGIPPEHRDEVLSAHFSTAPGGTGLGLAIVRRIAEAHGWSVAVTESADGGARFEFTRVELC